MASSVIDVAALIAPIPGAEPAGNPVPYPVRQKLRAARKETEPHPDDPSLPDIPRKVDWKGLSRLCEDTLTKTSKDLEVAMQLAEAATKLHGFIGVRDSLKLLTELVSQCWDRLHPIPEEGEGMEVRSERFHWISEADYGAQFPRTIYTLPLIKVGNQVHGLGARKLAQEGRGPIPAAEFERSVPLTEETPQIVDACLAELTRLEQVLQDKLGDNSPSLIGLREALEDCQSFMQILLRKQAGQNEPVGTAPAAADVAQARTGASFVAGAMASRDDAYRQIANIADFLERLEPHSPIPDLLRRAVELGRLPFRKLVAELVRDNNQLTEIRREFGLQEKQASE